MTHYFAIIIAQQCHIFKFIFPCCTCNSPRYLNPCIFLTQTSTHCNLGQDCIPLLIIALTSLPKQAHILKCMFPFILSLVPHIQTHVSFCTCYSPTHVTIHVCFLHTDIPVHCYSWYAPMLMQSSLPNSPPYFRYNVPFDFKSNLQ